VDRALRALPRRATSEHHGPRRGRAVPEPSGERRCGRGGPAEPGTRRAAPSLSQRARRRLFTMPEEIACIALQNKRVVYGILFAASAATLRTVATDANQLGAGIGFLSILHTWSQDLRHHPHVRCVVPGGGLAPDGRWLSCRPGFFLPVRVMGAVFRGEFVSLLRAAFGGARCGSKARCKASANTARSPRASAARWRSRGSSTASRHSATGAGAEVPRALHASRRHRQPAHPRRQRARRDVSLARPSTRSLAAQGQRRWPEAPGVLLAAVGGRVSRRLLSDVAASCRID
jgi:hypothetical protein